MFICMPKINFINHFFLEILYFKKSWNLIGWQHFGPLLERQNFARCRIGDEISTTILVSIFRLFPKKLMTKFFEKSKKPYLGAISSPFCPNLGKNELSWKKLLLQFLDAPIIYHPIKNQKKLLRHFWEKYRTDGWSDGHLDRQIGRNDCSRFIKCSLDKKNGTHLFRHFNLFQYILKNVTFL